MGGDGHLGICEQTRLNHQSGCKNKKEGRLKSNKCIYWDSLILLQFNINMYYKGVNWGNN